MSQIIFSAVVNGMKGIDWEPLSNRMGLIIGYSSTTKRGYCNNYLSAEIYSLP